MKTCFDLISECNCKEESNTEQESASDEWGGCPKCTFTTNYCQTKNKNLSKKSALDFFSIMCSVSK
jgi:DEAD/DEAH box helicase domain-containing protein